MSVAFITGKRILVTGGAGFLGKVVCDRLREHDPAAVITPRKKEYDLTEQTAVRKMLEMDGEPRVIQTVRGVGYVLRRSPA